MKRISIGCGSAYANDRLEPAAELADSGRVSYLSFDCLAERTLAYAQLRRRQNPAAGQDERIGRLVPLLRSYLAGGGRVIGNFGAANPPAAVDEFCAGLRSVGLTGTRIGVVTGDDVLALVRDLDADLPELGTTVEALGDRVVCANAYLGAEPIVDCLEQDAQLVVGGRLADPSLFVAPICHELGWALDDWDQVGAATLVGHLLECGVHATGGQFEDPPFRVVKDPHRLAFPYAEVSDSGAVVTKLDGTGGAVDERTIKTQLYYEIHDPARYLTPDVTADFSDVVIEEVGPDRVRAGGARGAARPDDLKVLVGVDQGWRVVGEVSYGGPGCIERARRAEEIVRTRLGSFLHEIDDLRIDLQGVDSLFGDQMPGGYPAEVRLRLGSAIGVARDRPGDRVRDRVPLVRAGRRRGCRDQRDAGAGRDIGVRAARTDRRRDRGGDGVKLREIAYSRSGDKGDTSNICVFVYDPADYPQLLDVLTADVVRDRFGSLVQGDVVRYELPRSHGLNFVLTRALARRRLDERACRSARQVVPVARPRHRRVSDIGSLLDRLARTRSTHPALHWVPFDGPGRLWTYGELVHDIYRLAAELQRRGVSVGDRVVILGDNSPDIVRAWAAVPLAGGDRGQPERAQHCRRAALVRIACRAGRRDRAAIACGRPRAGDARPALGDFRRRRCPDVRCRRPPAVDGSSPRSIGAVHLRDDRASQGGGVDPRQLPVGRARSAPRTSRCGRPTST